MVVQALREGAAVGGAVTRPTSNQPTPAALTDAPRLPNAADVNGQRRGVRVYLEPQRAAPTTVGALSLELPKEALEVRTRFPVQPSCSSSRRCSLDRMYGVALSRATSGPPARFGGQGSPSPRCVSVGDVRSEALLTARSADPLRALSYTRGRLAKRWDLHIPTQRNRDGASRAATFFGGA